MKAKSILNNRNILKIFWFIILLPVIVMAWPLWQSPTFAHQPFALVIGLMLFFRNNNVQSIECRHVSFNNATQYLLLFIALFFYTNTLAANLLYLCWLFVPIILYVSCIFLTKHYPTWSDNLFIFLCAVLMPNPWPFDFIVSTVLTYFSRVTSILFLFFLDTSAHVKGVTIYGIGKRLTLGVPCGGINGFYVTLAIIFLIALREKISRKSLFYAVLLTPISLACFNGFRIFCIFSASYFMNFADAVTKFHQVGPIFFIPHILLITFVCRRNSRA